MKQFDKEKKLVGECLCKAFAWHVKFGSSYQHVGQQYIEPLVTLMGTSTKVRRAIYTTK